MVAVIWDMIIHIDQHLLILTQQYGLWIYAILFIIIFCETGLVVTPFLPGDSLLFAAGSIAAVGSLDVHLLILLLLTAAVLGDSINFAVGSYFGEKLFTNPDSRIFKQKYLHQTQNFYAKHGGKTIVLARFVPIVRTFAPFVAGMGKMYYPRFIFFNITGAVLWVCLFTYLGYFFGNLALVKEHLSLILLMIIVISMLPISIVWYQQKKQTQSS